MQSVEKYSYEFFLQSAHLPRFFNLVMHWHVLGPCYACFEYAMGIEGYVTSYLACYVKFRVQNMPGCHLRMHGWEKWTDWRKKLQQYFCADCIHFLWLI
jgi:hypothetical protein